MVVHEGDFSSIQLQGRRVTWMMTPGTAGTEFGSVRIVEVEPGTEAKLAHSHPTGEELVYTVSGEGRVKIGEAVHEIKKGSLLRFPRGVPHMLHNTGEIPLKGVCFYAPQADSVEHAYLEDIDF